jgi:putative heme-binding domain-containing protein
MTLAFESHSSRCWFVRLALAYVLFSCGAFEVARAENPPRPSIWDRSNWVAWCIVPFDSEKRTPAQRVAMLKELGLRRFAYDYRAEHLPTFDQELELLRQNEIELTAIWFPTRLNDEAKQILELLKKHHIHTQLWVMGGGELSMSQAESEKFLTAEVDRIRQIAEAADKIGCKVALYNHGKWFGEPENQLAIIERLKMPNVGIVYNLHHAHHQLDRLPSTLSKIKPHLLALNLNGMRTDGDRIGHKILPIGEGDRDLSILKQINDSGYSGPIGILNHTNEDAKLRLQDNMEGLEWCLERLKNEKFPPKPTWRSYRGAAVYSESLAKQIAMDAAAEGNAAQGLKHFASEATACLSCHVVGQIGGKVGPELTSIGTKRTPEQIATSLLWPHREIEPAYQTYQVLMDDGRVVRGYRISEGEKSIVIREPASGVETKLARDEIENEKVTGSSMPETLVASLSRVQQLDLIAFVSSLGRPEGLKSEVVASLLEHSRGHKVAEFPLIKGPIDPNLYRWHGDSVNRDRVFDFYAKQAEYFRTQNKTAELLNEYPGLDGREFGHWGNQDEKFWAGDEWNDVELGSLQCHTFKNGKQIIARGVCVRLNSPGQTEEQAAACFNTDTLQYEAFWRGGFLAFSSVRHGFLDGVKPIGEVQERPEPIDHQGKPRYQGFYRYQGQTIFAYRIDNVDYLDSASLVEGQFIRTRLPAAEHPLNECLKGGPSLDEERYETEIELGHEAPYAIDTIAFPTENRTKSPFFAGDLGFASDGTLYVATMHGDVWHVSGFQNPGSKRATWRRFASGLHHALGVVVHDDQCYVLGRNQITRLHDLNGDGQADWYECFSNAMDTSPAGHDFICGLQRDETGCFYTASGNQGLLKISPDGQSAEVLATGFRNPDGLGLLPGGSVTIPGSEGDWTPTSMICMWKPSMTGKPFFGHRGPQVGGRPELPFLYLPRGLDNSSGGQVYVSSDRWGPLKGNLVHLSHGTGTALHVMLDEVEGRTQAAAVVLSGSFRSGVHRGRFSPLDGQLYVAGMTGWGSYAPETGCLQRLRYVGQHAPMPVGFHVHENGVAIRFSDRIDDKAIATSITDRTNCFAQVWNYRYSANYGSSEYSSLHPGVRGHDRLAVESIHLLDEGKTLFVAMPALQPVNQLHIRLTPGSLPAIDLYATVHRLGSPRTDLPNYRPVTKSIAAHPIEIDLANALKRKPNPWRKKIKEAREITIEAGQNLSFATRDIRVQTNEAIALTFSNPDVVPHNWALINPGSLAQVGDLVNRLISDPDAAFNQYIPVSDDVLCYTDIIEGHDKGTIYFHAPSTPGRYPFVCTFPGHWMVMNGEMIVE